MIKEAINTLVNGENLNDEVMTQVMEEIMTGEATDAQKASFLTALSIKGETIDEITAAAKVMSSKCTPFHNDGDALEIVGTGGDKANSFNISTLSAIVAAAAGVHVAKHGNRAASSKCGTADCLEALGVKIDIEPNQSEKLLKEDGICFLFAQKYHPAMKNVGPVRSAMKERTVFNILGPLTNPANASRQLLGVYTDELVEKLADVLSNLGVKAGMSVCGDGHLDEVTVTGPTHCCEIRDGKKISYDITPEQFGLKTYDQSEIIGGTPEENARITKDILRGKEQGAKRDIVLMNAGLGIYLGIDGITMEEGVQKAKEVIDSGAAYRKMEEFVKATQE